MVLKTLTLAFAGASLALASCASGGPGSGAGFASLGYDAYYDDAYGPFYDGYWGGDGAFWYRSGAGVHPVGPGRRRMMEVASTVPTEPAAGAAPVPEGAVASPIAVIERAVGVVVVGIVAKRGETGARPGTARGAGSQGE